MPGGASRAAFGIKSQSESFEGLAERGHSIREVGHSMEVGLDGMEGLRQEERQEVREALAALPERWQQAPVSLVEAITYSCSTGGSLLQTLRSLRSTLCSMAVPNALVRVAAQQLPAAPPPCCQHQTRRAASLPLIVVRFLAGSAGVHHHRQPCGARAHREHGGL